MQTKVKVEIQASKYLNNFDVDDGRDYKNIIHTLFFTYINGSNELN